MRSGEIDDINVYLNSLSGSERAKFQNYLKDKGYGKKKPKVSPDIKVSKEGQKQLAAIQAAREEAKRNKDDTPYFEKYKKDDNSKKSHDAAHKALVEKQKEKYGGTDFTSGTGGVQSDKSTTKDSGKGSSGYSGYTGAIGGGRAKGGLMKKR
jgi:hypothetical protein